VVAELDRESRLRSRAGARGTLAACVALEGFAGRSNRARRYLQRLAGDRDAEIRRRAQEALARRD